MENNHKNFIIIGAMKSATATLHFVLDRHPEISMSRGKEINYFLDGADGSVFEPVYEDNFDLTVSTRVLGEASPRYSLGKMGHNVPGKIMKKLPDAHVFYQIRNPVDRMISHYAHMLRGNRVKAGFFDTVKNDSSYLETSNYPLQAKPYLETFGAQLHWLDFDEIKKDPYGNAEKFIDIFGLKKGMFNIEESAHFNRNDKIMPIRSKNPIGFAAYQFGIKNHKKFRIVPRPVREFGKKILAGKQGLNTESPEFRRDVDRVVKEYHGLLEEIVKGSEELSGKNYSSWYESLECG